MHYTATETLIKLLVFQQLTTVIDFWYDKLVLTLSTSDILISHI